ncbi:MAG: hypothetical protein WCK02_17875 [Bacteroidota bacterium]
MIPVIRLIVTSFTGYPFGSFLKHGFAITFISHLFFGMSGSAAGFGISKLLSKKE